MLSSISSLGRVGGRFPFRVLLLYVLPELDLLPRVFLSTQSCSFLLTARALKIVPPWRGVVFFFFVLFFVVVFFVY